MKSVLEIGRLICQQCISLYYVLVTCIVSKLMPFTEPLSFSVVVIMNNWM